MRTFLIDTDVASDDAVALIMALRAPDVRVAAITTVAGNVGVEQATRNALYTVELCKADVPVFAGAERPFLRPHQSATWFHGEDGFGNHGYPLANRRRETAHAVDAMIDVIEANPGIIVVTLGPLTNLAMAIAKRPAIASKVGRCVVMGGAPCCEGNVTPAAEYNIWVDPDAAQAVMLSDMPVELIGWQTSRNDAVLSDGDIAKILAFKTEVAVFAIECNSRAREAYKEQTGEDGISLPDPIAMSVAIDPTIGIEWSTHYVQVETKSELTRGMSVVDRLNVAHDERNREVWRGVLHRPPNVRVCWTIDAKRWKTQLFADLER